MKTGVKVSRERRIGNVQIPEMPSARYAIANAVKASPILVSTSRCLKSCVRAT